MPKNMIGIDSDTLLVFWQGLLADLVVKSTGEKGQKVRQELAKFLKEQPCWVADTFEYATLHQNWKFSAEHILGPSRRDWIVINEERSLDMGIGCGATLDLAKVKLVPAGTNRSAVTERGELRQRDYLLLGAQSFIACWAGIAQLPWWWRTQGNIFFDGFALQEPCGKNDPFNFQWCLKMFYADGWRWDIVKTNNHTRSGEKDCSAVYCVSGL